MRHRFDLFYLDAPQAVKSQCDKPRPLHVQVKRRGDKLHEQHKQNKRKSDVGALDKKGLVELLTRKSRRALALARTLQSEDTATAACSSLLHFG